MLIKLSTCSPEVPYRDKAKQKAYQREWQKQNRKPRGQQGGVITKKKLILDAKSKPCECCNNFYHHSAMHFHHRNPSTKIAAISELQKRSSINMLIDEMRKCALLCANCHAEVHAGVREVPEMPRAGIEPARSMTDAF